jgi:hypothetical protein
MDIKNDEPKMSVNVHRKTTQLNLWIIVGVILFFALGGFLIFRVLRDPPDSTKEMRGETGGKLSPRYAWVKSVC